MKRKITVLLIGTCFTAALLAGCGQRMNGAQGQSGTSAQDTTGTQASGNGASNGTTQSSGTAITEEDAKMIALEQAGIARNLYALAGAQPAFRHVIGQEGHRFYAREGWAAFDEVTGWNS